MKILITGGAGYIGSKLIETLLNYAFSIEKITVVDNLLYDKNSLLPWISNPLLEFIKGDVRDTNLYQKQVEEADVIIPLACIVGMPACGKYPELAVATNETMIKWLAKTIKPHQKIIFPTTNSGYGIGQDGIFCTEETPLNPISLYGRTKVNAEEAVLKAGGVTLRLATVFGLSPRMRLDLLVNDFTYKALKDGYIVLFESHFKRNFIHINDVVEAFIFAINNYSVMKGQAYNVGLSSANISKLELCEKIKTYIPNFHIVSSEIGSDPDKRNYIVSNAKLEALGWKPNFLLDDGIKEIIKAYPLLETHPYTNL
jgi:nucleoside-diphosphate-sugar epimerase